MLPAALARRSDPRAARSLVEAALTSPLGADLRAAALFVRGTLRLNAGDVAGAAQDLSGAVDGALPSAFVAHAHNNLGIAFARLGRGPEALEQMETARKASGTAQAATLNLAILYDDELDDGRRALGLYDAYLRGGGGRSGEVREWADRLRELYP
jgi:Flp pilus assembly protein TadD